MCAITTTADIQNINAIFIVGHARSGTSLVNKIVQAHPKIIGGDETRLFRHFYDMFEFSESKHRNRGIYSFHKDTVLLYELIKHFVTGYFIPYAKKHISESREPKPIRRAREAARLAGGNSL